MRIFLGAFIIAALVFTGCKKDVDEVEIVYDYGDIDEYAKKYFKGLEPWDSTGIYILITREGKGEKPVKNELLYAYFTGSLLTGHVFDSIFQRTYMVNESTEKKGKVFAFINRDIKGWNHAIQFLTKGSKATVLIPSEYGYGEKGTSGVPGNADLRFDIELLDIE